MKKTGKLLSFITAAGICFSLFSASFQQVSGAEAEDFVYSRYDTAKLDSLLGDFEKLLDEKGKEEEIKRYYNLIIEEADYISFQEALAQVQYSQNVTEANLAEYNYMTTVNMLCDNSIALSFTKGINSQYRNLMKQLLNEGYLENTASMDYKIKKETEEFLEKKNDLFRRYSRLEPIDKNEISESELTEYAQIYLDTVKLYNTLVESDEYNYLDYAYQLYGRDYTPDDIKLMNDSVKSLIQKSYQNIKDRFSTLKSPSKNLVFDSNIEIAQQYSYRISDELSVSADEIIKKGLYRTGKGDNSEQKSYTTFLNYYNTGIIYQYLSGDILDLSATVHEFGHFNSMRQNSIPMLYIHNHNLDIAEVQSQGLEVLYTDFYDSIYGADAEYMRMYQAMTLISAVGAGFIGNEFEDYVFDNADNLTAEDVLNKYNELTGSYMIYNAPFYKIPHFFQYPGYYISYAVSALAALDLWDVMYKDFDRAVSMYTELSHISTYDSIPFEEALESAGFDDVLSADFINGGASEIISYLASGHIYGDADENGTLSTADLLALVKAVLSPESTDRKKTALDMNNDGEINVADIMLVKKIISG